MRRNRLVSCSPKIIVFMVLIDAASFFSASAEIQRVSSNDHRNPSIDLTIPFPRALQANDPPSAKTPSLAPLNNEDLDKCLASTSLSAIPSTSIFSSIVSIEVSGIVTNATDIAFVGSAFRNSYNRLNDASDTTCDPISRQVDSVSTILQETMSDTTRILFRVTGRCLNCDDAPEEGINLFDGPNDAIFFNEIQEELIASEKIRCICPNIDRFEGTNATGIFESPLIESVKEDFTATLRDSGILGEETANQRIAINFAELNEIGLPSVESPSCHGIGQSSNGEASFMKPILLELQLSCFLIDDDLRVLEAGLVEIYNTLASTRFCDPRKKRWESATVIRRGETNEADGLRTIEVLVEGTCINCNPADPVLNGDTDFVVFDLPRPNERDQVFLEVSDTATVDTTSLFTEIGNRCYCATEGTAGRGPSEPEYVKALQFFLEKGPIRDSLDCVASLAECELTTFSSSILIGFDDNLNPEEASSEVNRALKNSLNILLSTDRAVCRDDFRVVQEVEGFFDVNPNEEFLSGSTGFARRLQEPPQDLFLGDLNETLAPSLSPTQIFAGNVGVFFVSGVCNGCSTDFLLSNQVLGSRVRRGLHDPYPTSQGSSSRKLQFLEEKAESNCVCPTTTTVTESDVLSLDLQLQFQKQLESDGISLEVQKVEEVNVVECEEDLVDFITGFPLSVLFTGSEVTESTLSLLSERVEEVYNNLNAQYCDNLIRRILEINAPVTQELPTSNDDDCQLVTLSLDVDGTCRECEDATPLLDEDGFDGLDISNKNGRRVMEERISPFFPIEKLGSSKSGRIRHRRLEDSNLCFCDRSTIADRAPTIQEFVAAFNADLLNNGIPGVCGLVAPTPAPTAFPTIAPSDSPSECTTPLENSFSSFLIVAVQNKAIIDEPSRIAIGSAIVEASNIVSRDTYSQCDPSFRLVTDAEADLTLSGEGLEDSLIYVIRGRCESCEDGSDLLDTISSAAFFGALQDLWPLNPEVNQLLSVQEVDQLDCGFPSVEFTTTIIVDLVYLCPDQNLFLGDERLLILAALYVESYNRISPEYCDEFFRTLVSAEVVAIGESVEEGKLPVEILITGFCRGCDPFTIDVYDIPQPGEIFLSDTSARTRGSARLNTSSGRLLQTRSLQQEEEFCFCDAQAIAQRGPAEAEVIRAFSEAIEELAIECFASVVPCNFGTGYNADIKIEFDVQDVATLRQKQAAIEESFRLTLKTLFENNGVSCNDDFRSIDAVVAQLDFTLDGTSVLDAPATNPSRALDEKQRRRRNQDLIIPSASPTALFFADSSPSSTEPSESPSTTPSATPTNIFAASKLVLSVGGICNGCSNDIILSNQLIGRALRGAGLKALNAHATHQQTTYSEHPRHAPTSFERGLQVAPLSGRSNCYCQLTALIRRGNPTGNELQDTFQATLSVDLELAAVEQVESVACDDISQTTPFVSELIFPFAALPGVPDQEIRQLGTIIEEEYNLLVDFYCDPLIRKGLSLTLVDRTRDAAPTATTRALQQGSGFDDQVGCVNFAAKFGTLASCRGCQDGTSILDAAGTNERKLSYSDLEEISTFPSGTSRNMNRRRLQDGNINTCFCDASTIAPRAPSLAELQQRVEARLGGAGFSSICQQLRVEENVCPLPQPGAGVVQPVTYAIQLTENGALTEALLQSLQSIFLSNYNTVIQNQIPNPCDTLFQKALSINARGGRRLSQKWHLPEDGPIVDGAEADPLGEEINSSNARLLQTGNIVNVIFNVELGGSPSNPLATTRACGIGQIASGFGALQTVQSIVDCAEGAIDDLVVVETAAPSVTPTVARSDAPSSVVSSSPTDLPSVLPTSQGSSSPTTTPTLGPTSGPTSGPTIRPSITPSLGPSLRPSIGPSLLPSILPTDLPSLFPTDLPSVIPTDLPTVLPSAIPTVEPTEFPSGAPTISSEAPSVLPSDSPSDVPSVLPSDSPSDVPSDPPSDIPSEVPSSAPSGVCGTGTAADLTAPGGFCDGGVCCTGSSSACSFSGISTICAGACDGFRACRSFAAGSFIGENSCRGQFSCSTQSLLSVDEGSCVGESACGATGRGLRPANIGASSCLGTEACRFCGNDVNLLDIGDSSCTSDFACSSIARSTQSGGSLTIGDGSCQGGSACRDAFDEPANVQILFQDNVCNGENACNGFAQNNRAFASLSLPSGFCNGDNICNQCCRQNAIFTFTFFSPVELTTAATSDCVDNAGDSIAQCQALQSSLVPSESPSVLPSESPSDVPSVLPSITPSDVPSAIPSESPSEAPSGASSSLFELCATGTAAELTAAGGFCDGGFCCTGSVSACTFTGQSTICKGACDGFESCSNFAAGSFIGENSCRGLTACSTQAQLDIDENACVGERACLGAGDVGGTVVIGADSCLGFAACRFCGDDVNALDIGDSSCTSDNACSGAVNSVGVAGGSLTIGDGSCQGTGACRDAFNEAADRAVLIQDNVCNGENACSGFAENNRSSVNLSLPSGFCNGDNICNGCCGQEGFIFTFNSPVDFLTAQTSDCVDNVGNSVQQCLSLQV